MDHNNFYEFEKICNNYTTVKLRKHTTMSIKSWEFETQTGDISVIFPNDSYLFGLWYVTLDIWRMNSPFVLRYSKFLICHKRIIIN